MHGAMTFAIPMCHVLTSTNNAISSISLVTSAGKTSNSVDTLRIIATVVQSLSAFIHIYIEYLNTVISRSISNNSVFSVVAAQSKNLGCQIH